jgi:cytochrome c-type biogenesis protein CcmH/NrfG
MRFCPHCGAPLVAGAKFCVECGRPLAGGTASMSGAPSPSKSGEGAPGGGLFGTSTLTAGFVGVFVGITAVGIIAALYIMFSSPGGSSTETASIARATVQPGASSELPPGHPKIELPAEARRFIEQLRAEADGKPQDVATWARLGAVAFRAGLLDPGYFEVAEDAFAHVIKLDPKNPDALRGLGDINYERNNYEQAILAYEQYLKQRPDDANVLTDAGTMYLYSGKSDAAIERYKKAIAKDPKFFQAYYNMAIAYGQRDDAKQTRAALTRAYELAPDDNARAQVRDLLVRMLGESGAADVIAAAKPVAAASPAPAARPTEAADGGTKPAAAAATAPRSSSTFEGDFEKMVRELPIAGAKVRAVEWPAKTRARVVMNEFPMDEMPDDMKTRFLARLKTGIQTAKKEHRVATTVEVDLVDSASGKVMQSVAE